LKCPIEKAKRLKLWKAAAKLLLGELAASWLLCCGGIETVGKRPLVFRMLHLPCGTLHIFIGWNTRGKNNRRIAVVLVSFPPKCISSHRYSFVDLHAITIRRTRIWRWCHAVL
jgi:hypothetical protein